MLPDVEVRQSCLCLFVWLKHSSQTSDSSSSSSHLHTSVPSCSSLAMAGRPSKRPCFHTADESHNDSYIIHAVSQPTGHRIANIASFSVSAPSEPKQDLVSDDLTPDSTLSEGVVINIGDFQRQSRKQCFAGAVSWDGCEYTCSCYSMYYLFRMIHSVNGSPSMVSSWMRRCNFMGVATRGKLPRARRVAPPTTNGVLLFTAAATASLVCWNVWSAVSSNMDSYHSTVSS